MISLLKEKRKCRMSNSPTRLRRQHAPIESAERRHAADAELVKPPAGPVGDLPAVPPPGPAEPMVAVPAAEGAGAPEPKAAPKKRGRPPGSRNKPKPPPATVPADAGAGGEQVPQAPVAPEPEQQPEQPEQPSIWGSFRRSKGIMVPFTRPCCSPWPAARSGSAC